MQCLYLPRRGPRTSAGSLSSVEILHLDCGISSAQKPGLQFGATHSYVSLEKLGEGTYASVYKGISRYNGTLTPASGVGMGRSVVARTQS